MAAALARSNAARPLLAATRLGSESTTRRTVSYPAVLCPLSGAFRTGLAVAPDAWAAFVGYAGEQIS
ncbi:hypothetical protein ADK41_12920 [Streptomyces caelestis]|uniref:Uncharacterized protein n=1 Tax=Streptomyces caelestis TaxID=36816 RepID=A0A0M8QRF9_9ACTN|nr:hypothetical protein ADK41_12920 [Streptomyces caelestis]KOV24660.1 hypothetical protein ADK58_18955 [Streptomyces sp. XY152]